MRSLIYGWLVVCAMAYSSAGVRAEDAKVIVEKGVKALGGAENLGKHKVLTWKGKGTFHGLGMPIEYTGEWFIHPPKQMKGQIEADFNGMKLTFVQILNGDKGYMSAMGNTQDLEGDQLAEMQNEFYEGRVASLLPLLSDSGFKLASLGESKVGDKAAVGVKVSHDGHQDVSLFFDKDSGLLLKSARKAKDTMNMQDVEQETLFGDYQDFDGIKRYKKRTVKRDGKDYNDMQIVEYKPLDKVDEHIFDKPGQ